MMFQLLTCMLHWRRINWNSPYLNMKNAVVGRRASCWHLVTTVDSLDSIPLRWIRKTPGVIYLVIAKIRKIPKRGGIPRCFLLMDWPSSQTTIQGQLCTSPVLHYLDGELAVLGDSTLERGRHQSHSKSNSGLTDRTSVNRTTLLF